MSNNFLYDSDILYKECLSRQIERHGSAWIVDASQFDFSKVDYSDLQDMATVASECTSYDIRDYVNDRIGLNLSIDYFWELNKALNEVVYDRLGVYANIFRNAYKNYLKHPVNSNIYTLLAKNNRIDVECFSILQRVIAIHELARLSQEDDSYLDKLIRSLNGEYLFSISELGIESTLSVSEKTPDNLNRVRDKVICEKTTFIEVILEDKDFDSAFWLMNVKLRD